MNIQNRIKKYIERAEKRGIGATYICSPENHMYFSGVNNPDGQILITGDKTYMFADFRYIEAVKRMAPSEFEVIMPSKKVSEYVADIVSSSGIKKVGYENDLMHCSDYDELVKKIDGVTFVPVSSEIDDIRRIKTDEEVDSIVKAQRIAEKALQRTLGLLNGNMTELDVVAELEYSMKKFGAENISFDTIAVSGSNSSSPHGLPRNKKLEKGFLTMDFGALIDGYHSDMTRTVVLGKADDEIKRVYDTVLKAQLSVEKIIGPGRSNFQMDKTARDIIEKEAGYEGCFDHGLGHGVGLRIHELPVLNKRISHDVVLEKGEVVTVEPGIYIGGKYGCRIEDMVYITENGARNLTEAPKEMVEIEI